MGGPAKVIEDFVQDTSNTLTQVTQPIEKAVTKGVTEVAQDPAKAVTNVLQPVEKAVNYIGANPNAQAAIALAVAAPITAGAITPYLGAFGAYASVAANAITSITVQVAQGVPIEQATQNAMVNVGISGVASASAGKINEFLKSPAITDAITSTVASGVSTAAQGGSQADIEKAMAAGLAGSSASSLYSGALGVPTDSTGAKVVGTVAKEAALDKTPEQVALSTVSQLGEKALTDYFKPTVPDQSAAETARLARQAVSPPLDQTAAEDARLARQIPNQTEAETQRLARQQALLGQTKGAYLPDTAPVMPDQTEAETARLAQQEAAVAGSTKGAYLPSETEPPPEEPKQGAYLPDSGPEGLVAPAEDTAVSSGLYKPSIFTATVKPKTKSAASTQVLGQALGTTTGLTAARGAGEIEGTGTGGQRKKVWNEESLKLKDALGV